MNERTISVTALEKAAIVLNDLFCSSVGLTADWPIGIRCDDPKIEKLLLAALNDLRTEVDTLLDRK